MREIKEYQFLGEVHPTVSHVIFTPVVVLKFVFTIFDETSKMVPVVTRISFHKKHSNPKMCMYGIDKLFMKQYEQCFDLFSLPFFGRHSVKSSVEGRFCKPNL